MQFYGSTFWPISVSRRPVLYHAMLSCLKITLSVAAFYPGTPFIAYHSPIYTVSLLWSPFADRPICNLSFRMSVRSPALLCEYDRPGAMCLPPAATAEPCTRLVGFATVRQPATALVGSMGTYINNFCRPSCKVTRRGTERDLYHNVYGSSCTMYCTGLFQCYTVLLNYTSTRAYTVAC